MVQRSLDHVSQEAIVTSLIDLRGALNRAFFISLAIAVFVVFLVYEESVGSDIAKIRSHFQDAIETQDAVLAVSDALLENPKSLRRYSEYMEPFISISSSAEQAIVAVEVEDERWLNLDPVSRDLAREHNDSVSWLEDQVVWFQGDSLRSVHVENLKQFSQWVIFPEPKFDTEQALRILQAEENVAIELGQNLSPRTSWPDSFYFHDFVDRKGFDQIAATIDFVRDEFTMQDVTLSVDRIDQLCIDNELNPLDCTPNGIARVFDDEPNLLVPDEQDEVTIDFFPIGVDRQMLIWLSPPLILAVFFRFIGQENKWRQLKGALAGRDDAGRGIEALAGWAVTDALRPQSFTLRDPFSAIQETVMVIFVGIAIVAPTTALGLTIYFGWRFEWHVAWLTTAAVCFLFSVGGLVGLLAYRSPS